MNSNPKQIIVDYDAEESEQNIHVLVAEDDTFQKLALIDLLSLINFQATAVQNGRLARDQLLREDVHYDLVLLDLYMPEMNGLELLQVIQQNEQLKQIPVIMMSADNESDMIATCINNGAQNYLVKPLRVNTVKQLREYVKKRAEGNSNDTGKLKKIRLLGSGAAGSVDLVENVSSGQKYALQTIPMDYMNEKQKLSAKNEAILLKVLRAPTIINYYDSWIQGNKILILMQYAPEGCLYDRISELKNQGKHFDDDQILYFISQLIIAVLYMHNKNILHRDIQSQNLFLTKQNVLKLGDFGIAQDLQGAENLAQTVIGTPYFMSPEVIKGEKYNQKADIWAIGCTLYEMTMLRRPFQCDSNDGVNALFEMIKFEDFPPIRDSVSTDVKQLISLLLSKQPLRRPSVWDLVSMQCINQCIQRFYEEEAQGDAFLDEIIKSAGRIQVVPKPIKPKVTESEAKQSYTQQKSNSSSSTSQNDVHIKGIAQSIYDARIMHDVQGGIFKTIKYVFTGEELHQWFMSNYLFKDQEKIRKCIEDLISNQHIVQISDTKGIKDSEEYQSDQILYRFQRDEQGIPSNKVKIWIYKEIRDHNEIMEELITMGNDLLKVVSEGYLQARTINQDQLMKNIQKFYEWQEATAELQILQIEKIKEQDYYAFFANLLQIMTTHHILMKKIDETLIQSGVKTEKTEGILSKTFNFLLFFRKKALNEFHYEIGNYIFTIPEIKHGILRGNKKGKGFAGFSKSDNKMKFVRAVDRQIIFLFSDDDLNPQNMIYFTTSKLSEQCDQLVQDQLSLHCCFDSGENELTLPKIFQTYQADFGKNYGDVVMWIKDYVQIFKGQNIDDIVDGIKDGSVFVQFEENE